MSFRFPSNVRKFSTSARGSLLAALAGGREVASLVVRGFTNRAIAAELYINELTVEKHVTGIWSKLDFSTRTELAAYVAPAEPVRIATN